MGKLEYLDALKRAMAGLPPDIQAKTLAYYEQRFVNGVAMGRRETDIAEELGDPNKIAMTLRANAHMGTLEKARRPTNPLRLMMSVAGLAVFNLLMVVPAMVYAALLAAVYFCALGLYASGIAVTSSALAGPTELVLMTPFERVIIDYNYNGDDEDGDGGSRRERDILVLIGKDGVNITDQPVPPEARGRQGDRTGQAIRIISDVAPGTRTTQTMLGLGMLLGGIGLFLLALVITRMTLAGIQRYTRMNISLLKGH